MDDWNTDASQQAEQQQQQGGMANASVVPEKPLDTTQLIQGMQHQFNQSGGSLDTAGHSLSTPTPSALEQQQQQQQQIQSSSASSISDQQLPVSILPSEPSLVR